MTSISLTVTSDIVCAFCYIGFKELMNAVDTAKKGHPNVEFAIEYKPFLLLPTLNCKEAVDRSEFLMSKFGEQRFRQVESTMNARGKELGLDLNWNGRLRQSISAHRLLTYAYKKDPKLQLVLLDKIFEEAFINAKDVGDHEVLATLTEQTGVMTKDETLAFLASGQLYDEVRTAMLEAKKAGVAGIPFVVVNQKYAIAGAEKSSTYLDVFEKLIARGEIST